MMINNDETLLPFSLHFAGLSHSVIEVAILSYLIQWWIAMNIFFFNFLLQYKGKSSHQK